MKTKTARIEERIETILDAREMADGKTVAERVQTRLARHARKELTVADFAAFSWARESGKPSHTIKLAPKPKREKFYHEREDGLIPGQRRTIEQMAEYASKGLDLYNGGEINEADYVELEEGDDE